MRAVQQRRGGGGGGGGGQQNAVPNQYMFTGYRYFTDPEGYDAGGYPWGTLNAIDMNTGKYLWTVPFGEHTELAEKGAYRYRCRKSWRFDSDLDGRIVCRRLGIRSEVPRLR